jgi:hypothetical protein
MKICWDNLEGLRYNKTGKWYKKKHTLYYIDECETCKEPFLSQNKKGRYCSCKCFSNGKENKKQASINGKKLKGCKLSRKHKQNISISKKGQNKGSLNPMFGKQHTEKSKTLMKENRKGINKGIERPDHSIKMSGKGNPNWKGGLSYEPYCPVWKDKEYKQNIKERDGNKCQNPSCKGESKRLCIHHIDYNKKNCKPSNLITVCFSCNARANFNRNMWENLYENLINKMET